MPSRINRQGECALEWIDMFPTLFHLHHDLYSDDVPFWMELTAAQDGPILELGCGTGRVLIPLAQSGFDVYGLDRNFEMLQFLNMQRFNEQQLRVNIFQAKAEQFRLAERFVMILWACNTMGTFPEEAFITVLKQVKTHLRPGGVFVATMPNPQRLVALTRKGESEIEEIFTLPDQETHVQVSSTWKRMHDEIVFEWLYDVIHPDGEVDRYSQSVVHILHSLDDVSRFYSSARLEIHDMWGDYDRSAYTQESPYLIIKAM